MNCRFVLLWLALVLSPASMHAVGLDFNYCSQGRQDFVITAHADDDLYFINPAIQSEIAAGKCVKAVHLTGGYSGREDKKIYYQERINGSLLAYEKMAWPDRDPNLNDWTEYWDEVNGKPVHRYSLVVTRDAETGTTLQIIEVQDLGLPCGSDGVGSSSIGTSLAYIYNDAILTTTTIDDKNSTYSLANVSAFLEQIMEWANPATIFTTDPYGYYFQKYGYVEEAQHPDHIITAKLVAATPYVQSNPGTVRYFKTYNIDNLTPNLTDAEAIQKNAIAKAYWDGDSTEGRYLLPQNFSNCGSLDAKNDLWNDTGWLCKQYVATKSNYFYSSNLLVGSGKAQCLSTDAMGNVFMAGCSSPEVEANTFSLDGQGVFYVDNHTRKIIEPNGDGGFAARPFPEGPAPWHGWHYDERGFFQFITGDGKRVCMDFKNFNGKYYAISVDCGIIPFTPSRTIVPRKPVYAAPASNVVLQNVQSGNCVLLGDIGSTIRTGDCYSPSAQVSVDALGTIRSQSSTCLESGTSAFVFEQVSGATSKACDTGSHGQTFRLKRIDGQSENYLLMSADPQKCWEDSQGDLKSYGCNGYDQQIWRLSTNP